MGSANRVLADRRNYPARLMQWLAAMFRLGRSRPPRQLRLRETLALGERRFIAVVEFEQQKFLIAGTGSSVAMLTALPSRGGASETREFEAAHAGVDKKEKKEIRREEPEKAREEVPTWGFTGEGPAELIRI